MPMIGDKKYPYTKKGMEKAKEMGKKMGKPVAISKPMMKREMKPKGITITMMLKQRNKMK